MKEMQSAPHPPAAKALRSSRRFPPSADPASPKADVPRPSPAKPRAICKPLFSDMDSFARQGLTALPRILDEIMPLNATRRRDLPAACRELSALLTTDRADLSQPYWTTPRLTSAYLRYFMPWNLIRLLPLLPSLPLTLPAASSTPCAEGERVLVVDLGSGPFTLPLALWLSRPDFRAAPITLVCADTAPHPLHLGRDILELMRRELDPSSPWEIHALRAPLGQALRRLRGRPWLISAGNVLNELEEKSRRPGAWQDKICAFAENAARLLLPGGFLFGLEPGTRQGAKLIRALREAAMYGELPDPADFGDDTGDDSPAVDAHLRGVPARLPLPPEEWTATPRLTPLSPCPHAGSCPLDRPGNSAWCHVNAPAADVPDELRSLSRRAGLDKDSVSLSFLLMRRPDERKPASPAPHPDTLPARLLSEPFILPDRPGRARYACTSRGLTHVPDCAALPPGALCEVENSPRPPRDRKSGAMILPLASLPGPAPNKHSIPRPNGEQKNSFSGTAFNKRARVSRSDGGRRAEAPRQDKASEPRKPTSRKKFPNPQTGGAGRQA